MFLQAQILFYLTDFLVLSVLGTGEKNEATQMIRGQRKGGVMADHEVDKEGTSENEEMEVVSIKAPRGTQGLCLAS